MVVLIVVFAAQHNTIGCFTVHLLGKIIKLVVISVFIEISSDHCLASSVLSLNQ